MALVEPRFISDVGPVLTTGESLPTISLRDPLNLEQLRGINFPRRKLLTGREYEVLLRIVGGLTTKTVAHELGMAPKTVEGHRVNLMRKLNVGNTTSLVWLFLTSARSPFDRSDREYQPY